MWGSGDWAVCRPNQCDHVHLTKMYRTKLTGGVSRGGSDWGMWPDGSRGVNPPECSWLQMSEPLTGCVSVCDSDQLYLIG